MPPGAAAYGGHEHLEEENDSKENELKEKVSLLKQLTIDIGDEVKEHNRLLRDADDTFDSVGNVMSATIGKVKELAKSGYKYYFLYLVRQKLNITLLPGKTNIEFFLGIMNFFCQKQFFFQ